MFLRDKSKGEKDVCIRNMEIKGNGFNLSMT